MREFHTGISVQADRFSDEWIRAILLPALSCDGKRMSVAEFRGLCATARAQGYKVIPPCANTDEKGICKGHDAPPRPDDSAPDLVPVRLP